MRSVNVTYKIYEFSELSEDAKAKVKKWYLDNFCEPSPPKRKRYGRGFPSNQAKDVTNARSA